MAQTVTVLAYAGCGTCKKALKWLDAKGVKYTLRPIVEAPPTAAELSTWIAASGLPARKWLNTSGQRYRSIGKAKVDAASEAELAVWLTRDGKLVRRPVVVVEGRNSGAVGPAVLVGFRPDAFEALLGGAAATATG
jgi:arsenate reductase (glutaredoxin)